METSEKVSIFAGLNVKGGIPSPLHNPPMRVDTLSSVFVYSLKSGIAPAFSCIFTWIFSLFSASVGLPIPCPARDS